MVCEYVHIFTEQEFRANKEIMREILEEISTNFLIGDAGITSKNYVNYGSRSDGSVCILDFAYIYNVRFGTFVCSCDDTSILKYDENFVNLICPHCGRKYEFGQIRRRISRKAQEEEIGDIRRLSYNVTKDGDVVKIVDKFEPQPEVKVKKVSERQKRIEYYLNLKKQRQAEKENAC